MSLEGCSWLPPIPAEPQDYQPPREYFTLLGSDAYRNVKDNLYGNVDRTVNQSREFSVKCSCTPAEGCGPRCQNRLLYMECQPGQCPSLEAVHVEAVSAPDASAVMNTDTDSTSEQTTAPASVSRFCKNCAMQERRYPVLQVYQSPLCGFGLKACEPCEAGTVLAEYTGEVITSKECVNRMAEVKKSSTDSFYLAAQGEGLFLDAKRFGSIARFANHCCAPNSELQRWYVDGMVRLALVNTKPLAVGEEVTYNYGYSEDGMEDLIKTRQKCHCGAPNCCGTIGGKVTASPVDKWIARAALMLRVEYRGGPSNPTYTRRFSVEEFEDHLAVAVELNELLQAKASASGTKGEQGGRKGGKRAPEVAAPMELELAEAKNTAGLEAGAEDLVDVTAFLSYSPECRRLHRMMLHALEKARELEGELAELREKAEAIGRYGATKCFYYEQTTAPDRSVLPIRVPSSLLGRERKEKADDAGVALTPPVVASPLLLMNREQAAQYLESFSVSPPASSSTSSVRSEHGPIGEFMKLSEVTWFGELLRLAARTERRLVERYRAYSSAKVQGVVVNDLSASSIDDVARPDPRCTFAWSDLQDLVSDLAETLPILCDDYVPSVHCGAQAEANEEGGGDDAGLNAPVPSSPQAVNLVVSFLYNTVLCDHIARLCNSTLHNTCVTMWRHYHCARKSYIADINQSVESNLDYRNLDRVCLVYCNIAVLNSRPKTTTDGAAAKGHSFSVYPKHHLVMGSIRDMLRIPFEIRAWLDIYTSIYMNKMISLGVLDRRQGDMPDSLDALTSCISARLYSTRAILERQDDETCGSNGRKKQTASYCYCSLPEAEGESLLMVQCERCWKWFHHSCVNLDPDMLRRQLGEARGRGRKKANSAVYNCPSCCVQSCNVTSFAFDNNSGTPLGSGTIGYEWGIPKRLDEAGMAAQVSLHAVTSADISFNLNDVDAQVSRVKRQKVGGGTIGGAETSVAVKSSDNGQTECISIVKEEKQEQACAVDPTSGVFSTDEEKMKRKRPAHAPATKKGLSAAVTTPGRSSAPVLLTSKTAHSEYYFSAAKLDHVCSVLNGKAKFVKSAAAEAEDASSSPAQCNPECFLIGCPIDQLLRLMKSYLKFWQQRTDSLLHQCWSLISKASTEHGLQLRQAGAPTPTPTLRGLELLANAQDCLSEAYYELRILKAVPGNTLELVRGLLWAIGALPLLLGLADVKECSDSSSEPDSTLNVAEPKSISFAEVRAIAAAGDVFARNCSLFQRCGTDQSASLDGDIASSICEIAGWIITVHQALSCKVRLVDRYLAQAAAFALRTTYGSYETSAAGVAKLHSEFHSMLAAEKLVPAGAYVWSLSKEFAYVRLCNIHQSAQQLCSGCVNTEDSGNSGGGGEEAAVPVEEAEVFCWCRRGDLGTPMVGCDGPCGLWFHCDCLGFPVQVVEQPKKKRKSKAGEIAADGGPMCEAPVVEADHQVESEKKEETQFFCIACSEASGTSFAYRW